MSQILSSVPIFCLLPFLINSLPASLSKYQPSLPTDYYYKYILANSLKYNDPCTWANEEFRQNGSIQMKRYPSKSKDQNMVFDSIVKNTVENGRTYCPASEMMVCNKNTSRCGCGEPIVMITLGARYQSSMYTNEIDPSTGKAVCRWSHGAACSQPPSSTTSASGTQKPISKCETGSQCNSVKDGTLCSNSTMSQFVASSVARKDSFDKMMEDMLVGKMCVCGGTFRITAANKTRVRRSEGVMNVYQDARSMVVMPEIGFNF